MVGHTHEDVDAGFSKISDKLKIMDAETIPELINVIKSVGSKYTAKPLDRMLNVKEFLTPYINKIDQISEPLHFKFVSSSSGVNVFSKGTHNSEWKRHEVNILNRIPDGKPEILKMSTEKVSVINIKKVVDSVKNYFKGLFSTLWWNNFFEKMNEKINDEFDIKWIEDLPRQTDTDDLPLPDHIQKLVDKEQDKRPVRYSTYFYK